MSANYTLYLDNLSKFPQGLLLKEAVDLFSIQEAAM